MKHPFIFSFPRSGLHLTAKIINWPLYVNFQGMNDPLYVKEKIEQQSKEILFTHQTIQMINPHIVSSVMDSCLPIYVIRNPMDALLSWFFLNTKNTDLLSINSSILDFIMSPFQGISNKILLWKYNILGYKSYHNQGLVIRYENLIQHYSIESKKIADFLSVPVLDKLPELKQVDMSRKGLVGEHKTYFNNELINNIYDICKDEINYIDQYLI